MGTREERSVQISKTVDFCFLLTEYGAAFGLGFSFGNWNIGGMAGFFAYLSGRALGHYLRKKQLAWEVKKIENEIRKRGQEQNRPCL